jgi:hypothetical protein
VEPLSKAEIRTANQELLPAQATYQLVRLGYYLRQGIRLLLLAIPCQAFVLLRQSAEILLAQSTLEQLQVEILLAQLLLQGSLLQATLPLPETLLLAMLPLTALLLETLSVHPHPESQLVLQLPTDSSFLSDFGRFTKLTFIFTNSLCLYKMNRVDTE